MSKPHISFRVLLLSALVIAVACINQDDPLPGPVQVASTERPTQRLEHFMSREGCKKRIGNPRSGDIGIFTDGETPERYTCTGIPGRRIRAAVQEHRKALEQEIRIPSVMGGYTIRHYTHSIRFCDLSTIKTYLGDELLGTELRWDDDSCIWRHYFWDEWIPAPYDLTDEITSYGGGGGGPYFSPDDELHREPTIDTMPDYDDHDCESWEEYVRADGSIGRRVNLKCHLELDDTLEARIRDSLSQYLRPLNQIADTLARRECDSLRTWFTEVLAYDADPSTHIKLIWKGRTDSLNTGRPHDAQAYGTRVPGGAPVPFHIDPKVHRKANTVQGKKFLLSTILHEIVHSWGYGDHPDNADQTQYAGLPYFGTLHSGACVI